MDRTLKVELTNMCLVEDKDGKILLQLRTKKDWPGWTLPGGHVEKGEDLVESIKREVKEETGLDILDPKLVGVMEYKTLKGQDMYINFIYKATKFKGNLHDSTEGHLIFAFKDDIKKEEWAYDMDLILDMIYKREYTDIIYKKQKDGEYNVILA